MLFLCIIKFKRELIISPYFHLLLFFSLHKDDLDTERQRHAITNAKVEELTAKMADALSREKKLKKEIVTLKKEVKDGVKNQNRLTRKLTQLQKKQALEESERGREDDGDPEASPPKRTRQRRTRKKLSKTTKEKKSLSQEKDLGTGKKETKTKKERKKKTKNKNQETEGTTPSEAEVRKEEEDEEKEEEEVDMDAVIEGSDDTAWLTSEETHDNNNINNNNSGGGGGGSGSGSYLGRIGRRGGDDPISLGAGDQLSPIKGEGRMEDGEEEDDDDDDKNSVEELGSDTTLMKREEKKKDKAKKTR